ncbi:mechanosensitive ion channel family protein [Lutibacter sp. TH_r2]|uniref:mechanosensitive ion channel family protein n=1 Tax=Lutibacter sp. TH_r2 TaxID=3082083 RepID=UPI002952C67A|nr:mechanosensitive ion channel family protein [Lutibacter sp. TH_r2]MDV7186451.1 mechanosensitive ion channel family protein [Lutibacter sp. TH_r2]
MESKTQIILIVLLVVILFLFIFFTKRAVKRFTLLKSIEPHRKKVILNILYFIYYQVTIFLIIAILGVDFKQFLVFISSILAVLGVGFFAQWSLLSNLTSSFILFFYHPVRIGDHIKILDKDFDLTGKVKDIKGFYLLLKTDDEKIITIPNSVLLQKGIELLKYEEHEKTEKK